MYIWFLNLACRYHEIDLHFVHKSSTKKDYLDFLNHTPESYFWLGCNGPFGCPYGETPNAMFPIIRHDSNIMITQHDKSSCGVVALIDIIAATSVLGQQSDIVDDFDPNTFVYGREHQLGWFSSFAHLPEKHQKKFITNCLPYTRHYEGKSFDEVPLQHIYDSIAQDAVREDIILLAECLRYIRLATSHHGHLKGMPQLFLHQTIQTRQFNDFFRSLMSDYMPTFNAATVNNNILALPETKYRKFIYTKQYPLSDTAEHCKWARPYKKHWPALLALQQPVDKAPKLYKHIPIPVLKWFMIFANCDRTIADFLYQPMMVRYKKTYHRNVVTIPTDEENDDDDDTDNDEEDDNTSTSKTGSAKKAITNVLIHHEWTRNDILQWIGNQGDCETMTPYPHMDHDVVPEYQGEKTTTTTTTTPMTPPEDLIEIPSQSPNQTQNEQLLEPSTNNPDTSEADAAQAVLGLSRGTNTENENALSTPKHLNETSSDNNNHNNNDDNNNNNNNNDNNEEMTQSAKHSSDDNNTNSNASSHASSQHELEDSDASISDHSNSNKPKRLKRRKPLNLPTKESKRHKSNNNNNSSNNDAQSRPVNSKLTKKMKRIQRELETSIMTSAKKPFVSGLRRYDPVEYKQQKAGETVRYTPHTSWCDSEGYGYVKDIRRKNKQLTRQNKERMQRKAEEGPTEKVPNDQFFYEPNKKKRDKMLFNINLEGVPFSDDYVDLTKEDDDDAPHTFDNLMDMVRGHYNDEHQTPYLNYDPTNYGPLQNNYNEARKECDMVMNVPTKQDLTRQIAHIKQENWGEDTIDQIQTYAHECEKLAALEADIHQHKSLASLAWLPSNLRNPLHKARIETDENGNQRTVIRGKWVAMVKRQHKADLDVIDLEADWVRTNIKASVLRTIQDAALSMYTYYKFSEKTSNGKIVQTTGKGFLKVQGAALNYKFEDQEIQHVRYVPRNKKRNIEAHFEGLSNGEKVNLTDEFIKANFEEKFIKEIVTMTKQCHNNKPIFCPLPPGRSRGTGYKYDQRYIQNKTNIPVNYMQRKGEDSCLVSSLASALHYIGTTHTNKAILKQYADTLHGKRHSIINRINTWKLCFKTLHEMHPYFLNRALRHNAHRWDILNNAPNHLVSVVLLGSDGKKDHSVAVVGDLLFDSNFEFAVKLCKDTLDLCCSTDTTNSFFKDYVCACDFPQLHNFAASNANNMLGRKQSKSKTSSTTTTMSKL